MSELPKPGFAAFVCNVMFLGIILDFLLIGLATVGVSSPLKMPGGFRYLAEAVLPLLVYGAVFWWVTLPGTLHRHGALRPGTAVGVVGGLVQVIHMTLENVGDRIGENSLVALGFMLSGFLVWSIGGYIATRKTGQLTGGLVAGCWSAMMSVLMAVTFGLILMTANIPSPAYVATWGEFKQSGWTDAHAFAIANSFEAVLGHLVIGPVIGIIFGFLGGEMAKAVLRRSVAADRS